MCNQILGSLFGDNFLFHVSFAKHCSMRAFSRSPFMGVCASHVVLALKLCVFISAFGSTAYAQNLSTLSLSPTTVTGGASSTGTVTLSSAAPAGGAVVNLSSNKAIAIVPSSVTVAAGTTSRTFTVSTVPVAANVTATITGTRSGVSKSANLQVRAPVPSGVTLNPTSVIGGNSSTGNVTLTGNAPTGGTIVTLSSSSNSATVPSSIVVAAGTNSTTFTVNTTTVTTQTNSTISAVSGGTTKSATLTIKPPAPAAPVSLTNIRWDTVRVKAPPLSSGATSLTLQKKKSVDTTFTNVATGLAGGTETDAWGLIESTNYDFRYLAVGTGWNSAGPSSSIITLPQPPTELEYQNINASSFEIIVPPLPAGALSLRVERDLQGDESTFETIAESPTPGSIISVSGMVPGQSYYYRCVSIGNGGASAGYRSLVRTNPIAPDAVQFPAIGPDYLFVFTPSLPIGASLLRLEKKLASDPPDMYSPVSTGYGSELVRVGDAMPNTQYSFRCVAIIGNNSATGLEATVLTSLPLEPLQPPAPTISVTNAETEPHVYGIINRPSLSPAPTALKLQKKIAFETDASYATAIDFNNGYGTYSFTMTRGRIHVMRYAALHNGTEMLGPPIAIAVLPDNFELPAPDIKLLSSTSLQAFLPALPPQTNSLKLQVKLAQHSNTAYEDLVIGQLGLAIIQVSQLTPGEIYDFRCVAVGPFYSKLGHAARIGMTAQNVNWTPGTAIACAGIRYPATNTSIAPGAEGRLSAYAAVDWDIRSVNGEPQAGQYSDPCSYTWSDNSGRGVSAFKNGNNTGPSPIWIAPSISGTYTITLVVDDQNGANKAISDQGGRNDASLGYNDDPVKFSISVTVP
jgi:hypothetical protein